jgi:folate-binding protein YgfZ
MWRSPLHDELAAHGAHFAVYGDHEIPRSFGDDVLSEYKAVRMSAGALDLSYRRKLRVTGSDRAGFLHGMLSNDVTSLSSGQGCHAAFLTVQAHVVADLRVYVLDDAIVLDAEPAAAPGLRDGLERHIIADDVEITDVTASYVTLSVQGPHADQVIRAAVGDLPHFSRELDHVEAKVAGHAVRCVRVREAGELGYELLVPAENGRAVWRAVAEDGVRVGLRAVGREAFNVLRVEAGIPWYGLDMDESRIVLEVGLDDAISTTKGCYLGQEVVERASARGHVNRRLTGLRMEDRPIPAHGAEVRAEEKAIGVVTSAVDSPALGRPIAMAYIRRELLTPGTRVEVAGAGGPLTGYVTSLPFYGR